MMELTELSLAPKQCNHSSSSDHAAAAELSICSKKRKLFPDQFFNTGSQLQSSTVDLQLKDPLPLDWEQCLDLESGKMYYLNRKTLKRTWKWPKHDQKLDLELNISRRGKWYDQQCNSTSSIIPVEDCNNNSDKQQSGTNMVALACLNCHLLVILSKTSPACPNCKYVHSLPTQPPTIKSLNTLSLLN